MRNILILLLFFFPIFVSCESVFDFNGAWALKESYDSWKKGNSEEIIATEIKIGEKTYLYLTHSIIFNSYKKPAIFSVPGGKWKINNIEKMSDSLYSMILESMKTKGVTATVSINILSDKSIYFTTTSMSNAFKLEFDQSFLLKGKEFSYIRCDSK